MYLFYLLIIILILHKLINYNNETKESFSNVNNNNIEKTNMIQKFRLKNIHNNYNNYEKKQYYLRPDCIFDTSCILEPNNHSFQNYNNLNYDNNAFYSSTHNIINKPNRVKKNITKLHQSYKSAFKKNLDKNNLNSKINMDDVVIQSCLA